MEAFEDSNGSYRWNWDEQTLKGKRIGGLFNLREYQDRNGGTNWSTNLAQLVNVKCIEEGTYKMPADKPLKNNGGGSRPSADSFVNSGTDNAEFNPFA